ncbi:hypothetical protein LCGC14_2883440 [marine sediment metagenome]|uniref:DUF2069 domain-containing protein n=1 Tax=marine sediment metagenome TaxID=412755 RepID=A0A0F8XZF7_9ZZZZ
MSNDYAVLAKRCRAVLLLSYFSLLAVVSLNTLVWPTCNRSPNGVIWGIQVLLLLVFLPGMLKQNVRAYAWLTFVLLGFFMTSVSTAFACTSVLTLVEVVLTVILFIAAMMYIRWRSRELKSMAINQEH